MKLASFPICAALCAFAVSSCVSGSSDMQEAYLEKAKTTMQSVYTCYSVAENFLLRENYPFDDGYKAGYLASEEQASRPNPYSYLWPFSGTLSAVAAIMETEPSYQDILTGRVLPGLEEYYDAKREPHAYSSYIKSAPASDRFYDDNVWLGIDFTDLYVLTEKPEYLEKAEMIWKFIESGIDDKLGGGIYWCEQKKGSKNTCSNAPGSVFALKLYKATGNPHYLEQGKALYEWTRNTLMDSDDFLYFDNINLSGKIQTWKFAYNSGQMVQAGALLYGITGASGMEDKLKELGIPFMYIGEYMEESPLGKAEWCVPVAEVIGQRDKGIEIFRKIPQRYDSLKSIASQAEYRPKVMVNIPYGDAWIMSPPGSYIGRLITDAGADYIYPGDTTEVSRTIDIEEAYKLVSECDYWINTGRVATKAALIAELPKFSGMPCLEEGRVYNNNLRLNGRGGDDFWESGIMHPDIILEDLITIFHPGLLDSGRQLYYYRKLE